MVSNVYDKAYELAKVLQESNEIMDYQEAIQNLDNDLEGKKMLEDFRHRQSQLQKE